jgi:uncharacterized protein (TIGR03435 family)
MAGRFAVLLASFGLAWSQDQTVRPAFEVASVKPTTHGRNAEGWSHSDVDSPSPGRFHALNGSIGELVRFAYDIKEYQLSAPDWMLKGDGYDIEAKAAPGTTKKQMRPMVQTLLQERFKLAIHRETRMLPVYVLTVAKGGPKLQTAAAGERRSGNFEHTRLTSRKVSMPQFAEDLSREMGQIVQDRTGISGSYDIVLEFAPEEGGTGLPSIFTAIQQQLGLKLSPSKGPVEFLVVDHAEKVPTGN